MKYTAIILAFYFLALALLPCGDASDCIDPVQNGTVISSADREHHDNHVENCSPFCICSCCGQFMYTPALSTFQVSVHANGTERVGIYRSDYLFSPHDDIWQPPKWS